jgi:hypothetical protein
MSRFYSFFRSEVAIVLLCFLVALCLRFYPALFLDKTLVFGDNYSLMVPGKIFTAEWLRQGILPLWNPLIFSGLPWLADINQSILYFSTLFFVWFTPAVALNVNLVFHWAIAFVGAYFLGKQWTGDKKLGLLAGSLWLFSTHVSGSSNNFSTLQSLVWLPLISYCGLRIFEQKIWVWWFAVAVTLQFLGGYPQHVLYAILAAVWLSATDQFGKQKTPLKLQTVGYWLGSWLMTGVVVLCLSAVAWMPFVGMLQNSTRMVQTAEQATVGSLDLPMLLVKPWLAYGFDKPVAGIKWGPAWSGQPNVVFYLTWVGLATLIFKFLLKRDKLDHWFFWPIVLSLVFALGGNLPGFTVLQNVLPFLKIARYPSMILIATNLWMIVWLVQTWQNWQLPIWWVRKLSQVSLVVAVLSFIVWARIGSDKFEFFWNVFDGLLRHKLSNGGFHTWQRDQLIIRMILENLFIVGSLSMLSFWYARDKKWLKLWLVLTVELWYCTQAMFFFAPQQIYDFELARPMVLPTQNQVGWQYRSLTRNVNKPYADYGTYWEAMVVREPFSDSFITPAELEHYGNLGHLRDGYTPDWNLAWGVPFVHGYTTLLPRDYDSLWRQSVNPATPPRINFLIETPLSNQLLQQWAVRYYLVDTQYKISEDLSNLPLVSKDRAWEIREIPGALARFRFETDAPATLTDVTETPQELSFLLQNSDNHALLTIADRFDLDWMARINGQPIAIQNYQGMRRLPLQPGENKITLIYKPKLAYYGLWITLATVGGFLAVNIVVCLTRRR